MKGNRLGRRLTFRTPLSCFRSSTTSDGMKRASILSFNDIYNKKNQTIVLGPASSSSK